MPEIEWEKTKKNEEIKFSPVSKLNEEQMTSFKMVEQRLKCGGSYAAGVTSSLHCSFILSKTFDGSRSRV